MQIVLVALAGAGGAVSRYGVSRWLGVRGFPWATLAINILGSFVLGWVLHRAAVREWSADSTAALSVGFLGAFTTFSTFSAETWTLLRTDRAGLALLYVLVSVIGGVLAAAAGYRLA